MAVITITIPDHHAQRVVDAMAETYGWTDGLGMSKADFAKKQVLDLIVNAVVNVEVGVAVAATRTQVEAVVRQEITLT